jgi:endonuclease G
MTRKYSDLLAAAERFREARKVHDATAARAPERAKLVLERVISSTLATKTAVPPVVSEARSRFLSAGDRLALERRIGTDDLKPVRFLELGMRAARAVGRIVVPNVDPRGDMYGTAFLVAPGIAVTNHHVLEEPYWAEAARIEFGAEDDLLGRPRQPQIFSLKPQTIYFSDQELDFAVVAVADRSLQGVAIEEFGFIRVFAATGKIVEGEYANIIQHPAGRQKEICVRNNKLTIYNMDGVTAAENNNFLYYEADTEGGSSGAPVFNDQWYLIALHRRSVPRTKTIGGRLVVMRKDGKPARDTDPDAAIDYIANEGARVSRIVKRIEDAATAGDSMARSLIERWSGIRVPPSAGPVHPIDADTSAAAGPQLAGLPALELVVRRESEFEGAAGYDPAFLGSGHVVPLPTLASEIARAAAPLKDGGGNLLLYDNFSVIMNAERRMAFYAAWNIAGADLFDPGSRPKWSYDPRMEERFQPHDDIFSVQLNRGHIVRRKDVAWGPKGKRAHAHTFNLTNVLPQINTYNDQEWGDLEDHILRTADNAGARVSVFAGPIFSADDPFYVDLKRGGPPRRRSGPTADMRIPLVNWKIVAWVDGGALKAAGFIRDQRDELAASGPLELSFGGTEQRQDLIATIEARTGLTFGGLATADTLAAAGMTGPRPLGRLSDMIL